MQVIAQHLHAAVARTGQRCGARQRLLGACGVAEPRPRVRDAEPRVVERRRRDHGAFERRAREAHVPGGDGCAPEVPRQPGIVQQLRGSRAQQLQRARGVPRREPCRAQLLPAPRPRPGCADMSEAPAATASDARPRRASARTRSTPAARSAGSRASAASAAASA